MDINEYQGRIILNYKTACGRRSKHFSDLPDYFETSQIIKVEIELFTRNLQKNIDFLDNDCTAEQLSWMSEVFEKISARLQSSDFIDVLNRCADKYPEE